MRKEVNEKIRGEKGEERGEDEEGKGFSVAEECVFTVCVFTFVNVCVFVPLIRFSCQLREAFTSEKNTLTETES